MQNIELSNNLGEIPGTRKIRLPDTPYSAEVYQNGSYLKYLEDLINVVADLKAKVFMMDPKNARDMIEKHMRVDPSLVTDLEIPSVTLFSHDSSPGYIGYATQRIFPIYTTTQGTIPLLSVTRTITEEHQRHHLGRFAVHLSLIANPEATWLGFRTQSPAAVRSMMEARVFRKGGLFPWEARYTSESDLHAHQLMMGHYYRIRKLGATPKIDTGVSIHDYEEENKAYKPDTTHIGTMQLREMMESRFRMDFKRGDSIYTVGELI